MLNTPETNLPFDSQQTKQLELYQSKVFNLQNEITIATRNHSIISKELVALVKEREYQQELIQKFTIEATEKNKEVEDLKNAIDEMKKVLADLKTESEHTKDLHVEKEAELKKRESALLVSETESMKKIKEIDDAIERTEDEKEKIKIVRDAFSNALKTITWN